MTDDSKHAAPLNALIYNYMYNLIIIINYPFNTYL